MTSITTAELCRLREIERTAEKVSLMCMAWITTPIIFTTFTKGARKQAGLPGSLRQLQRALRAGGRGLV